MNQVLRTSIQEPPSGLMGTLAIMGFSAEGNLRDVAHALGKKDLAGLARVAERNARQIRLRNEVQNQVAEKMSQRMTGARERHKLLLATQTALMFEKMGAQTVEMARLCEQVIREPRPSRVTEIKKLIEHAVYIADRAATGLVEENMSMAMAAQEQHLAAIGLYSRIDDELAPLIQSQGEAAQRAGLLHRIAGKAQEMIGEASHLAHDIIAFLERSEF